LIRHSLIYPSHTPDLTEAGIDEAGRGCLAGPVVAAAVILPKDFYHKDLNDSKQLSSKKREILREIIENEAVAYAVAEIEARKIDEINILQASFLAMHQAVSYLKIQPELLLVDGNQFKPYPSVLHLCIVKGDAKYAAIAAASVLAKTYRDTLMTRLALEFPAYGWERNFAYPTAFHCKAIEQHGLTPYHRRSFRVKKA
jgi:ribonuclease HII